MWGVELNDKHVGSRVRRWRILSVEFTRMELVIALNTQRWVKTVCDVDSRRGHVRTKVERDDTHRLPPDQLTGNDDEHILGQRVLDGARQLDFEELYGVVNSIAPTSFRFKPVMTASCT